MHQGIFVGRWWWCAHQGNSYWSWVKKKRNTGSHLLLIPRVKKIISIHRFHTCI